jgi:hypothetical protein
MLQVGRFAGYGLEPGRRGRLRVGRSEDGGRDHPTSFRVSADSAGFEVVCFHTHL